MYTGLTAKLTVDGITIGYISNWSVEETRDTIEATELGKKEKTILPSLYSWTASTEGTADFANKGQKALREAMLGGKQIEVKFYLSDTDEIRHYFNGKAYVTSFSTDISADDKGNVSISLTGDGALEFADGATPLADGGEPAIG